MRKFNLRTDMSVQTVRIDPGLHLHVEALFSHSRAGTHFPCKQP